jgi:hypothetical protein
MSSKQTISSKRFWWGEPPVINLSIRRMQPLITPVSLRGCDESRQTMLGSQRQ